MLNPDWRPPTLYTDRLLLRPLEVSDIPAIFLYASNPRITTFTLFDTHQTLDDTRHFVLDYASSRYQEKVPEPLGIVLRQDPVPQVIGCLGCYWYSMSNGVMELGYALAEPYWGRGIVTEAARALLEHVFATYPVYRVQAGVFPGNTGSARVATKLGMKLEGTLRGAIFAKGERRDVQMYAILRPEWHQRPG